MSGLLRSIRMVEFKCVYFGIQIEAFDHIAQ